MEKLKKLSIDLTSLLKKVVNAEKNVMDNEARLTNSYWEEYDKIRTELISLNQETFESLKVVAAPTPQGYSSKMQFYKQGTLVYKGSDFNELKNEINKALEYIKSEEESEE